MTWLHSIAIIHAVPMRPHTCGETKWSPNGPNIYGNNNIPRIVLPLPQTPGIDSLRLKNFQDLELGAEHFTTCSQYSALYDDSCKWVSKRIHISTHFF